MCIIAIKASMYCIDTDINGFITQTLMAMIQYEYTILYTDMAINPLISGSYSMSIIMKSCRMISHRYVLYSMSITAEPYSLYGTYKYLYHRYHQYLLAINVWAINTLWCLYTWFRYLLTSMVYLLWHFCMVCMCVCVCVCVTWTQTQNKNMQYQFQF